MLKEPANPNEYDRMFDGRVDSGKGFCYLRSPTGSWQIGRSGVAGQMARYDFDNQLSVAYICNGMKFSAHLDSIIYNQMQQSIYASIKKRNSIIA